MPSRFAGTHLLDALVTAAEQGVSSAANDYYPDEARRIMNFAGTGQLNASDETGSVSAGPNGFGISKAPSQQGSGWDLQVGRDSASFQKRPSQPGGFGWGIQGGSGLAPVPLSPRDAKPGPWGMATFRFGSNQRPPDALPTAAEWRSGDKAWGGPDSGAVAARSDWEDAAGRRASSSVTAGLGPASSPEVPPPSARDEVDRLIEERRSRDPLWYRP